MIGRLPRGRIAVLMLAMVAALTGLDAALLRLGLPAPVRSPSLAEAHGVLMVFGFLGTAITLERAVALRSGAARFALRRGAAAWGYAAPVAAGLGSLLLVAQVAGAPIPGGRVVPGGAWVASMGVLAGIYVAVWRRQQSYAVLVQALGALAGLGGAALWARGFEAAQIVPWWAGLLVLTIMGERLELARVAFLARGTEARVLAESAAVVVALVGTLVAPAWGYPLLGLALAVLVVDVAAHDVARRTVRSTGLVRFVAVCMLAGDAWALVAALTWVARGPVLAGFGFDVVVHTLTIGFVLSMIHAHAPVIVPAIVRRPLPYHRVMWAVWGLLQGGLAVRVLAAGRAAHGAWQLGGTVSVVALLAFLAATVALVSGALGGRGGRSRDGQA